MAYSNKRGGNPILLSYDIEVRAGISASGQEIAEEYIALGYEPGVGTTYQSTSGDLYIHFKTGTTGNDWSKVSDTPQPDKYTKTVTANLTPSMKHSLSRELDGTVTLGAHLYSEKVSEKAKSVSLTLTPSINAQRTIGSTKGTVTLTPEVIKTLTKKPLSSGITLDAKFII